jgi:hypothetical protein
MNVQLLYLLIPRTFSNTAIFMFLLKTHLANIRNPPYAVDETDGKVPLDRANLGHWCNISENIAFL